MHRLIDLRGKNGCQGNELIFRVYIWYITKLGEFDISIALTAALIVMCDGLTMKVCYYSENYFKPSSYCLITLLLCMTWAL